MCFIGRNSAEGVGTAAQLVAARAGPREVLGQASSPSNHALGQQRQVAK